MSDKSKVIRIFTNKGYQRSKNNGNQCDPGV